MNRSNTDAAAIRRALMPSVDAVAVAGVSCTLAGCRTKTTEVAGEPFHSQSQAVGASLELLWRRLCFQLGLL